MKTTIKTISLEDLAKKLNGKLWIKDEMKRIYINRGYNTKKMSTKTFVYAKEDGTFGVNCKIECPSQNHNWINSQENEIIKSLSKTISEIIEEFGHEIENPQIEIQSKLDAEEQVQGYYMRWHEVRVSINRFGKLATRKRQKVHTYVGPISKVPDGFVILSNDDFIKAMEYVKSEKLFEFGQKPDFIPVEDYAGVKENIEWQKSQL